MGDLLELKTSPRDQVNYMISSDGLKFYVKGKGSAAIGLTTHPNEKPENWITIEKTCRKVDFMEEVTNVNMISDHTYKPFWISWYGKKVQVGEGDNPKPFLVQEKPIETINYISFSSPTHYSMYWKLRLPPKIKQPVYKKINDGQLKWVNMDDNHLPEGALIGGYENEVLYIMRAMHEEALTPGKFVPSKGAGYVAWGYDAHKKTDMEILCGYDGMWVQTEGDRIPYGALVGGYTEYGETMFVGRAVHNEVLIPGKIAPSHKVCYIPYNGKEIAKHKYEILIPLYSSRDENKYFFTDDGETDN